MTTTPLEAALRAALLEPTPDTIGVLLGEIPQKLLQSEVQRRRSLSRTADQRRGPTGHWSKHNPNVPNCRCKGCHVKRNKRKQ